MSSNIVVIKVSVYQNILKVIEEVVIWLLNTPLFGLTLSVLAYTLGWLIYRF